MIFEYKCRRCGETIAQEYEGKRGFFFEVECAMGQTTTTDFHGVTTSPYPNWIFHKDCEEILYDSTGSFTRSLKVPGIGIADLIGGRQN